MLNYEAIRWAIMSSALVAEIHALYQQGESDYTDVMEKDKSKTEE